MSDGLHELDDAKVSRVAGRRTGKLFALCSEIGNRWVKDEKDERTIGELLYDTVCQAHPIMVNKLRLLKEGSNGVAKVAFDLRLRAEVLRVEAYLLLGHAEKLERPVESGL